MFVKGILSLVFSLNIYGHGKNYFDYFFGALPSY